MKSKMPGRAVVLAGVLFLPVFSASAQYDLVHLGGAAAGYGCDVAVAGHYAFVAAYTGGLRVYDVANPSKPTLVAATNSGIPYVYDENVTIAGDYAYTGAIRDTNFHVYDISTPVQPAPVAHVFSGNYVSQIVVTGATAYVANTAEGFSVYDLSSPALPTRVTNFAGANATCVALAGEHAYVAGEGMLRVYSLTNPLAPVEVGKTNAPSVVAIAVAAGHAFLGWGSGIAIFDVSTPDAPVQVGAGLPIGRVEDLAVADQYLFAANWAAGVRMFDIRNPSHPVQVSQANTGGYAPASQGLCVAGNHLYVASGNTGFYVCAIVPRLKGSWEGGEFPTLSWPKPFGSGVTVEHTERLGADTWMDVAGEPVYTNGQQVLRLPSTGHSGFYRLRISP